MSRYVILLSSLLLLWGCPETSSQEPSPMPKVSDTQTDAGMTTESIAIPDSGNVVLDSGSTTPQSPSDAGLLFTPPITRLDGGMYAAPVHLTLGEIVPPGENADGSLELWITNRVMVAGTQLRITGVTPKPGPTAGGIIGQVEGWNSQVAIDGMYLSFYLTGNPIPPSDGVLTVIPLVTLDGHEICVTDAVVSDPSGNEIERSMGCISAP